MGLRRSQRLLTLLIITLTIFLAVVAEYGRGLGLGYWSFKQQYIFKNVTIVNKSSDRTRGLFFKTGFGVSEVTPGLTLGFQSYNDELLLTGIHHHAKHLTWSRAGYI